MVIKITSIDLYLYKSRPWLVKGCASSIGLHQSCWCNLTVYRDSNNARHNSSIIHNTSDLTNFMAFALRIAFKMLVRILTLFIISTVIRYRKKILNNLLLHNCPLRSRATLLKALNLCWRNTALASFQLWNPLVTNTRLLHFLHTSSALWTHSHAYNKQHSHSRTRLLENFALPQLVSHILSLESWKLSDGVLFQQWSVVLKFSHIKLQCRQHTIRTIIAFETAHAQNGIRGKVPRPLPGQPGLFLRPCTERVYYGLLGV